MAEQNANQNAGATKEVVTPQDALQAYGKMKLTGTLVRAPRRAGGNRLFIYELTGTTAAIEAYKKVMEQVKLPNARSGTALVIDNVTGNPLFFQPTGANGKTLTVTWTQGNPDVNPLGRFVVDDLDNALQDAKFEQRAISQERAKILAARSLGLLGGTQLSEPRGNGNQSNLDDMSPEEIEALLQQGAGDVRG